MGLYFLIAERDIQAIKIDALTHPDEWTRKLLTRTILLIMYELDFDKVSGANLRIALQDINAPKELKAEITSALQKIRGARENIVKQYKPLRDNILAHRDADGLTQYRAVMQNLNEQEVFNFCYRTLCEGIHSYIGALTKLLIAGSVGYLLYFAKFGVSLF